MFSWIPCKSLNGGLFVWLACGISLKTLKGSFGRGEGEDVGALGLDSGVEWEKGSH